MNTLNFALIGAGGIGKYLAHRLKQMEQGLNMQAEQESETTAAPHLLPHFPLPEGWTARLQGIFDEDPTAAEQAATELEASSYSSLNALLEDEAIQAVVIATPPFTHAELVQQALAHGKHVFCEKPMALRLEDCDAMLQAAQRAQRLLMVGHVLRLFPLFWLSKQLLEQGRIGRLLAVNVRRTGYDLELFSKGWRRVEAQSGGLVIEMNVHELDYMRWIGGEMRRVCAQGIRPMPGTDFVQHWQGIFEFETGAIGTLEASMLDVLGGYRVHLVGERGSMMHGGFGGELVVRSVDGEEERFTPEQVGTPDPYLWELVAFVRGIVLNEPLPFDGYDGRQAVALALACLQSIQTGSAVSLSGQ